MHHPHRAPRREHRLPLHEPAPRPRRGVSNLGLALIAVLTAALAAVLTWFPIQRPAAEAAVRSFLEEVRAGDVDAALARLEDAPSGPFLVPEALNADWEIVEVAQVGYERDEDGVRAAEVYAEIMAPDGTRLAHRYEVVFAPDGPLIADRLTEGGFYTIGVLEANGVAGPTQEARLLPGVYHFYESPPTTIADMNMPSVLVLGGEFIELGEEHPADRLLEADPELTEEGRASVDRALRDHLDACAAEREPGCPFGPLAGEHPFTEADPSQPWRVVRYPSVAPGGGMTPQGPRVGTVETGAVEVDVVPAGAGEGAEPFTVSCVFTVNGLFLAVDWETGAIGIGSSAVEAPLCEWLTG